MAEKRARNKPRAKSPAESSAAKRAVVMQPQPHGGALQRGNPGNKGGPGRPPNELRELSREEFWELAHEVRRRREAGELLTEKLEAINGLLQTFGRFGIGTQDTLTVVSPDIQARLARQVAVIHARATWTPAELLDALNEVWGA